MQQGIINNGLVLGSAIDNTQLFSLLDNGLKILFLMAFGMYVLFSFIAVRQIHTMKNTLLTSFSGIVQLLGYFHFAMAVLVFVAFLITP